MKVVLSGISLVLFALSAYPQVSQLRAGEGLLFARADGSGMVMVANDHPVMRFAEVGGEVVAVRVTPIDRDGAAVGGGRLIMIGPNEKREMRLRDEFATEVLRNARLRIEVLQGDGRVNISSVEEYGRGLQPLPSAVSSRPRAVQRGPQPTSTSRTLIDQAEAAGAIDSETALLYRVYDIFDDARLPQQYRGDDSGITEGMYLAQVVDRYPTLSAATQAAVAPFLIPPAYKNSWANKASAVPGVSALALPCLGLDESWGFVDSSNGVARVWYKTTASDEPRARGVAVLVDTVWPQLSGLMKNHVPKPDAAVGTCNGGDGRLDVYLVDLRKSSVVPYTGCQDTPAFVQMVRTEPNSTAIHELMHAFQFSYPLKACLTDFMYNWWTEGSATFAMEFVSRGDNNEHYWARYFLNQPWESLDFNNGLHEYGSYLLPFYLYRSTGNADFVSATWEKCKDKPALEAFDESVAGGFEKVWFDFVRFNANREGFNEYFKWDQLAHKAALYGDGDQIFSGGMDRVDPLTVDLPRLSAIYRSYLFFEEEWSFVTFWNGVNFNLKLHEPVPFAGVQYDPAEGDAEATKGARVQALIKIAGQWTHEDWTKRPFITFCRDMKSERIEALVVIISNSEFKDRDHRVKTGGGLLPVVFLSNMGCYQWKGNVMYSSPTGMNISTTATWERAEQSQGPPFVTYHAKGTESWNIAGSCSGSGTLEISPELSFLFTYNYTPDQSDFHRVSNAIGESTTQVSVNCPPIPTPVPLGLSPWIMFPQLPIFGSIPGARFVKVKEDGKTMDDSYTYFDGSTWTWHFDSVRE